MNILDQLYADRSELLDTKYNRSQSLIASNGCYYPETDFSDIDLRVSDITEQIEIVETLAWQSEAEAQAADAADELATQQSALGTLA